MYYYNLTFENCVIYAPVTETIKIHPARNTMNK